MSRTRLHHSKVWEVGCQSFKVLTQNFLYSWGSCYPSIWIDFRPNLTQDAIFVVHFHRFETILPSNSSRNPASPPEAWILAWPIATRGYNRDAVHLNPTAHESPFSPVPLSHRVCGPDTLTIATEARAVHKLRIIETQQTPGRLEFLQSKTKLSKVPRSLRCKCQLPGMLQTNHAPAVIRGWTGQLDMPKQESTCNHLNLPSPYLAIPCHTLWYLAIAILQSSLHISSYLFIPLHISSGLFISHHISSDLLRSLLISSYLFISPYISSYLFKSPHLSSNLLISPHISSYISYLFIYLLISLHKSTHISVQISSYRLISLQISSHTFKSPHLSSYLLISPHISS